MKSYIPLRTLKSCQISVVLVHISVQTRMYEMVDGSVTPPPPPSLSVGSIQIRIHVLVTESKSSVSVVFLSSVQTWEKRVARYHLSQENASVTEPLPFLGIHGLLPPNYPGHCDWAIVLSALFLGMADLLPANYPGHCDWALVLSALFLGMAGLLPPNYPGHCDWALVLSALFLGMAGLLPPNYPGHCDWALDFSALFLGMACLLPPNYPDHCDWAFVLSWDDWPATSKLSWSLWLNLCLLACSLESLVRYPHR